HSELELTADREAAFALRLRIPAWAGPKTALSLNGKHIEIDLAPGRFASVRRTWRNGDRIALELDIPLHVEAVDPRQPNFLALKYGSLALFALTPPDAAVTRAQLLSARQISAIVRGLRRH